jgi:2-C-methyl-D-erythritol 4-phosphate cytidylyltransferase / 2-C-methyl-D-erythritol 2,4-cyclodiphosphate synthase
MNIMKNAAIIVAAGSGARAATGSGIPKQYASLAGEMVLTRTLRAFTSHPRIAATAVVIRAGDEALYVQAAAGLGPELAARLAPFALGGGSRQQSVYNGLRALASLAPDRALIHDAARPFIDHDVISRVLDALDSHEAALAAVPVADTLKRESGGLAVATVDRANLWRAQTPQGFRYRTIMDAHEAAAGAGRSDFTDDASIVEWRGLSVALTQGSEANGKITTAEDLVLAERLILAERLSQAAAQAQAQAPATAGGEEFRTGTGFDVHAFTPGDHVTLCGLRIPHDAGLAGHSDADVALHALTDAILGAIGAGDIGGHFPPSDDNWKGAPSHLFLAHAARLARESVDGGSGGRIVNADLTIICERPKIGPHREAMRARVAEILGVEIARVSVKATTTEGLGFTGRREGIAAIAQATVALAPRRP